MELAELITGLSRPEAYPHRVERVEVVQTHISVVFLAGNRAYKIKKAVDLGFLDFTTLERRRYFCGQEVRLNARGAPDVYLGVVPVTVQDGWPVIGGRGVAIEYAVVMQRLPADRTLLAVLQAGELESATIRRLGERIAQFHQTAASSPEISAYGDYPTVAENVRENFDQLGPYVGRSIAPSVFSRLIRLSEKELEDLRPVFTDRARRGWVRDTHGDLHLEHVYWLPERQDRPEFLLVDCIEFNERFRFADLVSDLAFLVMDLKANGRPELAKELADVYFAVMRDTHGWQLLPFYTAYRAVVRGKVASFSLDQPTIDEASKRAAVDRAHRRFLLALTELAPVDECPGIILVTGLPGTGKTCVAEGLVETAGCERVSSDLERKHLAGVPFGQESSVRLGEEFYTPAMNERTYQACLDRTVELLRAGCRVVVDATFRERAWRKRFAAAARDWCVPIAVLVCQAPASVVRDRLARRVASGADASDADWAVYQKLLSTWELPDAEERGYTVELDTQGEPEQVIALAREGVRVAFRRHYR